VPIGGYPLSGWYDSECDKYYCGTLANEAVVLSGETDTVLYRIPLGGSVGAVGGEVTGLVAFAVLETRSVDIASRYTGLVKTSVTVGEGPRALAWGEGAARLYSANSYTDDVTVLTGDGFRVVRTLPVGDDPFCFAYSPVQRRLYVGHLNGHKVYVIKDTVGGIEETCPDSPSSAPLLAEPSHFRRRVSLSAPAAQRMSADLEVWSAAGQMVRELKPVPDRRGRESCVWDGRDWQGEDAPAGAYFVTLRGALSAASVKIVKLE
jgi:hypothetical protein